MNTRLLLSALILAAICLAGGGVVSAAKDKYEDGFPETVPYDGTKNPLGWNIPYIYRQDPKYPAYRLAFVTMTPTYKGKLDYTPIPLIGIGEVDLNEDGIYEVISFPTEEFEEEGLFCNTKGLCPHYITDASGKGAHLMGILYGWKVNRGDRKVNGFYTLRVYTQPEKKFANVFDEYIYNPKTKEYELGK